MCGYKVKCLLMGRAPKMRYCLWKSIKNHHIPTTDKLLFKFILNKTMKCNYVKKLALFYHDASCLQSYTVLIDRVIMRDTENKTPPNLIFLGTFG